MTTREIRSYPLTVRSGFSPEQPKIMPVGAEFLNVYEADGDPVVVFSVDPIANEVSRGVWVTKEGDERPARARYAGSVSISNKSYHVFLGRYANDPRGQ